MTNQIALFLGLAILAALAIDTYFFGTEHLVFLARKFMELIEWIAFWR